MLVVSGGSLFRTFVHCCQWFWSKLLGIRSNSTRFGTKCKKMTCFKNQYISTCLLEFFLNVFSDKNIHHYSIRPQTCYSATSCVRDQHATTAPAQTACETGRSLNRAQFMLQWLLDSSLNSLNSVKVTLHLGKTPMDKLLWKTHMFRAGVFSLEFFLNGAQFSLNSGNLIITEGWIRLNLKILSLTCMCLAGDVVASWFLTQKVARW